MSVVIPHQQTEIAKNACYSNQYIEETVKSLFEDLMLNLLVVIESGCYCCLYETEKILIKKKSLI